MDEQESQVWTHDSEESVCKTEINQADTKTEGDIFIPKPQAKRQEKQAYWKYVENLIELGDNEQEQHSSKQKRFFSFTKSLKR